MDVCIKNIGDEDWKLFKEESIKHDVKMGVLFNTLVREHKKECSGSNWNDVLYGEKKLKGILSKEDGIKLRKEFKESMQLREVL